MYLWTPTSNFNYEKPLHKNLSAQGAYWLGVLSVRVLGWSPSSRSLLSLLFPLPRPLPLLVCACVHSSTHALSCSQIKSFKKSAQYFLINELNHSLVLFEKLAKSQFRKLKGMENCQTKVLHNDFQGHTEHAIRPVTASPLLHTLSLWQPLIYIWTIDSPTLDISYE